MNLRDVVLSMATSERTPEALRGLLAEIGRIRDDDELRREAGALREAGEFVATLIGLDPGATEGPPRGLPGDVPLFDPPDDLDRLRSRVARLSFSEERPRRVRSFLADLAETEDDDEFGAAAAHFGAVGRLLALAMFGPPGGPPIAGPVGPSSGVASRPPNLVARGTIEEAATAYPEEAKTTYPNRGGRS